MMRTMYNRVKTIFLLSKSVGGGDSTTAVIDMQGFHSCLMTFVAGVFALTSTNKARLTIYESDDNTTYTVVGDADLDGIEVTTVHRFWDLSSADASTVTEIHYKGNKRYVKGVIVESGTVSLPMGAAAVLGAMDMKPSID